MRNEFCVSLVLFLTLFLLLSDHGIASFGNEINPNTMNSNQNYMQSIPYPFGLIPIQYPYPPYEIFWIPHHIPPRPPLSRYPMVPIVLPTPVPLPHPPSPPHAPAAGGPKV
ncbi:hypothetical protein ACH5RR_025000 [Cinchona calisaya]|uniref:Uncharacterized protein n=1 Tax=Cinchona calisaya TaxID=153742 RepID=A0ABD2Z3E4_9GENT